MKNIYYTLDNFPAKYTKFILYFNKVGTNTVCSVPGEQVWRNVTYLNKASIRSGNYLKWISEGSEVFAKYHHIYNKLEVFVPREYENLDLSKWNFNGPDYRIDMEKSKLILDLEFTINFSSPINILDINNKLMLDGVPATYWERVDEQDPDKILGHFEWTFTSSIKTFTVKSNEFDHDEPFDTLVCTVPNKEQILTVQWQINDAIPIKQMYEKKDAKPFFPKTAFSAVIDEYGNTLTNVIKNIEEEVVKPYDSIRRINDYLYSINYNTIDYNYAYKYFQEDRTPIEGGCTAIRNGNFLGRNLDWSLDETVEFIVRVPRIEDRFASVSVASHKELVKDLVASMDYNEVYKILPFYSKDGINENGVVCSVNVVPNDHGQTTGTKELAAVEVNMRMLVRYVLDHAVSAEQIVSKLSDKISIYSSKELEDLNYEVHFIIADKVGTYIVEFIDNKVKIINKGNNPTIITNFFINGVTFTGGKVNTPYSHSGVPSTGITPYASGLERYNLAYDNLATLIDEESMMDFMWNQLGYYNTYKLLDETKAWYSEYTGGGLTTSSELSEFKAYAADPIGTGKSLYQLWSDRKRNGVYWQTLHTSVYDIENKKLYIRNQEEEYEIGTSGYGETTAFDFNEYYTAAEVDKMIENAGKISHIEEGITDGTISVTENGITNDILVHGLKDCAYKTVDEIIALMPEGIWKTEAGVAKLTSPMNVEINPGISGLINLLGTVKINGSDALSTSDVLTSLPGSDNEMPVSQKAISDYIGELDDIYVKDIAGNLKNKSIVEAINTLYDLITAISESI